MSIAPSASPISRWSRDREVVGGHLADGAQGHRVVLTAGRHLVGDDVGDLQVRLAQRGVGGALGLLGLLDLRGQRLGPLEDGGPLLRVAPRTACEAVFCSARRSSARLDRLAAGGVGGEQRVDQGLVGTPGPLAGTDEVGVLAHESEVDHPPIVGAGSGPPGSRAAGDRLDRPHRRAALPRAPRAAPPSRSARSPASRCLAENGHPLRSSSA